MTKNIDLNIIFPEKHRHEYVEKKPNTSTKGASYNQTKMSNYVAKDLEKDAKKEKIDKDDPRHKELTDSLLLYIARDLAPLSIVDSSYYLQKYDEKGLANIPSSLCETSFI